MGDGLIKEYDERTIKEDQYPVLSSTMSGIYFQSDYFNQEVSTITNKGYKAVPLNFVTYRSMSDTDVFHFNVQNIVEKGIVSPAYPVFSTINNVTNNYFLTYQMNESLYFYKQLQIAKEGGTRYALSYTKLCKLCVYIPTYIEQEKIASFFLILDTLITLHQRKCKIWIIFSKTDRILIRGSKMDYKSLVKEYREQQLLTQAELAKKLNVGIADISRWENGKYEPTMKIKRVLKSLFIESGLIKGETNNE